MSFLFTRARPKTPQEVTVALNEWILRLDTMPDQRKRASTNQQALEEISQLLAHIRSITGGDSDLAVEPDQAAALSHEIYSQNVLIPLVDNLEELDFDARKDVTNLFTFLLRRGTPTVEYLLRHPVVLESLIIQAGNPEVHRNVGNILRECAKIEAIAHHILWSSSFWSFFDYVDDVEFEMATDNFSTLHDFLRLYPNMTSEFLAKNSKKFIDHINQLIKSNSYIAKRQGLRLQYELVRQRRNFSFMVDYIENLENLKIVMRLMKDKSKNIHYETFQLFKLFVANPRKPVHVFNLLARNRDRILDVLERLQVSSDRSDDKVFKDERDFIMKKIRALRDLQESSSGSVVGMQQKSVSPEALAPVRPGKQPSIPVADKQLQQQHQQQSYAGPAPFRQ